jgi:hypothetical protein
LAGTSIEDRGSRVVADFTSRELQLMTKALAIVERQAHADEFGMALVLALWGPAEAQTEKRVALVIGNAAYQHVPRLDNPLTDARLMAETLRALGLTLVGGGPQVNLDKANFDRVVQTWV